MDAADRHTEIVNAAARLFERGGVAAITMRAVAHEAGVSLRLVQYYGRSKDELLVAVLESHATTSLNRWRSRLARGSTGRSMPDVVRTFLQIALPTDKEGRTLHRVGTSVELLAMTDDGPIATAYQKHLRALADVLVAALIRATPEIDPELARRLALQTMAMAHGIGTLLLLGQCTRREAEASIDQFAAAIGFSDERGPRRKGRSPRRSKG